MESHNLLASPKNLQQAASHLAQHDAVLKPIIERVGLATFEPHTNYYQALVDSIIGQQLSVYAARAIDQRFRELFGGAFPNAEQILTSDIETLRGIGFSRAKASYVLDLAQRVVNGSVQFEHLNTKSNQEIIDELTAVKGIGVWTVHMFLMFCMGRLDVLAYGDLGVRNGIKALYGLEAVPNQSEVEAIAEQNHWAPYQSVAGWYVWQSLNNQPIG